MAAIDALVARVEDPALRKEIKAALATLRKGRSFGLVFEEHVPESVVLPSGNVEVGATVVRRNDPADKGRYQVVSVGPDGLTVTGGSTTKTLKHDDILLARQFGEPVYPMLTEVGSIWREPSKPAHTIVNGENYHALQLLLFQHRGEVDCIYIDPPYNSGARDWKYNNRYVDENDTWRHSKWLSFMEKRLKVAKELLNPSTGVLVGTIDENEVNHLGVLLEQVFPKHLRYMITSVINPKGTGKANFGRVDEQLFFIVPDVGHDVISPRPKDAKDSDEDDTTDRLIRHLVELGHLDAEALVEDSSSLPADERGRLLDAVEGAEQDEDADEADEPVEVSDAGDYETWFLRRRGQESSYRHQRPNQFYAIYLDEARREIVGIGPHLDKTDPWHVTRDGDVVSIYPTDNEGHERVWRYKRDTMQRYIDAGEIVVGKYNEDTKSWTLNHRKLKKDVQRVKTVWWYKTHDAGVHGSNVVNALVGRRNAFPFPKSLYAVKDTLAAVVRHRPNALILDFFAGSGTTLHATCLLNAEDDGQRRCILVTNNEVNEVRAAELNAKGLFRGDTEFEEAGIFESATRPRVEAAITGHRRDGTPVPGKHVGGRPYATGFPENIVSFRLDYANPNDISLGVAFQAIVPVLWSAAGGVGQLPEIKDVEGALLPDGCPFAVLLDEDRIIDFVEALSARDDVTHVWLVTDSERAYSHLRSLLPGCYKVGMLYRDFLRNFELVSRAVR